MSCISSINAVISYHFIHFRRRYDSATVCVVLQRPFFLHFPCFDDVSIGLFKWTHILSTTTHSSIGSYRYLLAVFAVSDMAVSFAHALILPTVHMTNCGVYFFSRHDEIIFGGKSYDTFFCLLFIVTFFQTFLILAYHFAYRYVTATRSIARSFTDNWTISRWTGLGVFINIVYIGFIFGICAIAFTPSIETRVHAPPEILEYYNIDLRNVNKGYAVIALRQPDAWTGKMIWHIPSVIGALTLGVVFCATACVVVYCIWQINELFKSSKVCFTAKTRKMQLDLFRALLIQTSVPVVLSYDPVTIILALPAVTGISLGAFGNVLFSITTIFPCIDAFFVLFFITRFRVAVAQLFRRICGFSTIVHPTSTST